MNAWFDISITQFSGIIFSSLALYFIMMIAIRIVGLRSFSKMSGHDFAITVAIGSILATTIIAKEPSVLQGGLAIAFLLMIQTLFSYWRLNRENSYLENKPLLLMKDSKILKENLKKAKITENDLIAKLREANVLNMEEVQAVVFEVTGDVSVLHGKKKLQNKILQGVREK